MLVVLFMVGWAQVEHHTDNYLHEPLTSWHYYYYSLFTGGREKLNFPKITQ